MLFYFKESEVIIEELRDDDIDYANMPSLVNLPNQIFVSHTQPPFLYQYVGDQVRIIQVLGGDPLVAKVVEKETHEKTIIPDDSEVVIDTKDFPEQKSDETKETLIVESTNKFETVSDEAKSNTMSVLEPVEVTESISVENATRDIDPKETITELDTVEKTREASDTKVEKEATDTPSLVIKQDVMIQQTDDKAIDSIDPSLTENNSAESGDDEASFGTPENSPKTKRKLAKGKYGKGKAPPPPLDTNTNRLNGQNACDTTSQESLVDVVNRMPNTVIQESGKFHQNRNLQVNPIAENKRRHKSKSPGKIPKSNTTAIGKLLQFPGKLAFWNKTDEAKQSKSDFSEISDHSRRSSNIEQGIIDEFQSCPDLTKIIPLEIQEDQISFKDAIIDNDDIARDIIDKSDALQKLIEAKIESHPEYKIVSLHAAIPTTSKSTDV